MQWVNCILGAKRVDRFHLVERHIGFTINVNHINFSLINVSYLNLLCESKILSKVVLNGSNLMRFCLTVQKYGMYGKHGNYGQVTSCMISLQYLSVSSYNHF